MNTETRRLRVLVALADEGSFTDAAIALGISQTAVSRSLASLERDLGVRLVHRTTREVSLTAVGATVLAHARRILESFADLERAAHGDRSQLRVGYAWSMLGKHTAEVEHSWQETHPDVEAAFIPSDTRSAGLLEGLTDIAILRHAIDDRRLQGVVVGLEPRYAAVASDHPLARRRVIRLDDFDGATIAIDTVTGTTSAALWPEGSGPTAVRHIRGIEEWLAAIASGRALGVSSAATVWQHPRPGVTYRRMSGVPPVAVTLAWRTSDPPPLAQDLVGIVSAAYAD